MTALQFLGSSFRCAPVVSACMLLTVACCVFGAPRARAQVEASAPAQASAAPTASSPSSTDPGRVEASGSAGPSPERDQPEQSYRYTHPHADRVVLMPSGDTQPKGTVFISDYELVLLQVGYAPTDRLQLAVGGITDFGRQGAFDFTLKASLHRSPWLRIAAQASADYLQAGRQALLAGRVGSAAQLCFEPACRSSATLGSFVVLTDLPSVLFPIAVSLGMMARVSDAFSLLFEYSTFWNASTRLNFIDQSFFLVSYGLRIAGSTQWGFDICFLRSLASSTVRDTPPFFRLFGVPFVAVTYRFQP